MLPNQAENGFEKYRGVKIQGIRVPLTKSKQMDGVAVNCPLEMIGSKG